MGGKDTKRDTLLVGTHSNLLAYDVEANSDIFYKDVQDGVNVVAHGIMATSPNPLAIVGGNCSIQGFNHEGNEEFWTVTGDNVTALAVRDVHKDGKTELLVGSEDFEIRIFHREEVTAEATEADVITGLTPMRGANYGYSLANGTIGVYNNGSRIWHAKSKHKVMALAAFDLDADGVEELVTGWSNGRLEVRHESNGELVYKDRFTSSIAQIVIGDYRMDNKDEIIACATDGEIRGYLQAEDEMKGNLMDVNKLDEVIKALGEKKQEMLAELRSYENNLKQIKVGELDGGSIPPNTKLNITLKPNRTTQSLIVSLSTNNDTCIKMAILFSDVLFEEESMVVHPDKPGPTLNIPLRPAKHVSTDILIKAVVGNKSGIQDHVFEMTFPLPRFACFIPCKPREINPQSSVTFATTERVNRVVLWLNQSFNLDEKQPTAGSNIAITSDSLHAGFVSVRDGTALVIKMSPDNGGTMQIRTENMELAGDIIQDLARYLKLQALETVGDFPMEMKEFTQVLQRVEELNAIRLKLSAEIADSSNVIKQLAIKAEDSRILNDMSSMTKIYGHLFEMNRQLIGEYTKRANNHAELLKVLKDVNHMIQKAARLRVGEHKTRVVNECRQAIKSNNIQALFKIIKLGHAGPGAI